MSTHVENQSRSSRMRFVPPPGLGGESDQKISTIGRYEIIETLGKGAMGIVYKARDPLLDRVVAIKTIVAPKNHRNRESYLERFEREAKAAAKMQHPGIVTIFDVGTHTSQPFMVLEYLPGDSLASRLDSVRIPLGRCVQIAIELADALGFAHRERIIHRDVKPANVLNAGGTHWKLADFGIARMPDSELTQVGIFMGTPGYSPPESIRDGQYTPQADVFAWGAVLYELISGCIPYEGPDTRTTNGYVLQNTARSPRYYDASIPEPIAEICMTALHPSIEVRYRDGYAAKLALEAAWESCISSETLSPKVFSSKEISHSDVGKLMHGAAQSGVGDHRYSGRESDPTLPPNLPNEEGAALRLRGRGENVGRGEPATIISDQEKKSTFWDSTDSSSSLPRREGQASDLRSSVQNDVLDIEATAKATAERAQNEVTGHRPLVVAVPTFGLWASALFAALITLGFAVYYVIHYS